jgi:hypothetical protein
VGYGYTCGAKNETTPGHCGRRVSERGVRCCCHGPGSCGHRGAASDGRGALYPPPAPPPPVPPKAPPRRAETAYQPTDQQLRITADIVQKIITDGWEGAVEDQLATVLNDDFWKSVPRLSRKRPDCRLLADLANVMERTKQSVHNAIGAMADEGLGWLGRPTVERRIGAEFAKRIPLPGDEQIVAVIHALRITGIWVCLPNGISYVVTRCPCFNSLAKDKTKEELKRVLNEKLNVLETRYGPTWLPS